ncbi:uncharacterized protein LOC8285072 [Ricinus communis]|uniref:uncharacterized protein LOC8285072 n=1 Tax=Ricinus communis TaxID=3988 RepID=UPI00077223B8|nr:uncharacterized protein LOC8285072 [Ricinus communis]XP_015579018.1 uncharacterized protein LOC8285072 [Ricinus communis]XP_048229609.1 uncharacterized protein LOC8285072 [Ricinus communis]|eukprot:XP_015579017.1 uncharacterized protein LOC8285072 [Ricinus communis]
MPGNKVEDGIHNIYELDNCSRRQHPSQAVGGSWPEHDYNQWVGKPAQIVTPPNFNLKNYSLQRLDTVEGHASESLHVPFDKNYSQLTPRSEYSRSLTLSNPLSANEFLLGCQNFLSKQNQPGIFGENTCYDQRILNSKGFPILKSQHENECADSPTLTTNSERSEITEASSDFNFLTGQQQLARDQELSATQNYLMQQPGYNDMQLLQQHMMFKQLQEFQRQQQLQQLGDLRPQNSLNQFSTISRQTTGGQFSPLINGTPVHDASQMLRNWMHRGASPATQGLSNKAVFSQEQGQALRSMGLTPQQLDASLYGSPTSNTRGNMSQYAHLQGLSHESVNLLAKASGQVQKSMMQSSGFGGPYLGDQPAIPDPIGLTQGALISKQEILMKNNSGQAPFQGLNSGVFTGNLPEVNTPQVPASGKEFSGRHEQAGWPAIQQTKQLGASQGLVPLDPMEAKILYNMDDNIWDAFGSRPDTSAGGLGNTLEHPDSSYAFPSIQSGSWSALMQSAVAEASSSDTGLQEEWSGLTFQNTEQSTDNQISNFVDSEKQPTGWVDNNLQSASSFSSKPFPMITDSSMNSSFPGFQHPGTQISVEQREDICQDGSHESIENYNPQQKSLVEDGQKVQTIHSDNAWSGQMFEHSQNAALHQKGSSSNITLDNKGSKSIARTQHQMSNGPHVALNSFRGVNETREMQHNYQQKESSNDCSRGSSSHEQGHIEQFKFFGNVPSSVVSVDKASLPDFQGSSRAPDEVPSRGDHGSNASTNFHGSVLPDGSNATGQTSEHMLELLHKVDHLKDDSTIKQFESTDCNSLAEMPGADSHDTSVTQMYAQSCASQGFGLRLAPPSQRLANSNSFLHPPGLPQTTNNPSSRQVNPESGDKNQAWLTPSLFQSSPHPYELAQRAHWDNKSGTLGQANFSRYMNMQGSTAAPFSPGLTQARSQPQMRPLSNVPVTSQSLQAALPGATTRFPPFNHALSQDASQQTHSNADNQQFPVLNTLPKSQHPNISGMSQPGENSARPYNVWRNVPTQRQPFGVEPVKFSNLPSSKDPTNTSMISTSQVSRGLHDQNSLKGGYKLLEVGASSHSHGFDHKEEHPGKEMLQQRISSEVLSRLDGASQGQEPVSDATALTSGLLVSTPQQQEQGFDKARHSNNMALATSEKNLDSFSHSHHDQQNYSLLHQVQAMNNGAECAAALGGQQLHDNISRFRRPRDDGLNSTSVSNSFPSGDGEMLSFPAEAREGVTAKAPLQTALQSRPSQEMARFGYNDSHVQSSSSNELSNHMEHGHVNLHMAHSLMKQYGALRNGQMAPMFDARLATAAALQLSRGKPSQNLHIHTPLEMLDVANVGQGGRVWPSAAAALVASQQLSSPYMLPPEVANQMAITRTKKRKVTEFDLLPWHKEVTQDSKRLQNISLAEQDWAQATNRLIEKVEDEVEVIEDLQPMHRTKRRLILTTQLVQQLFRPAPASIFSRDAASSYGIISYFVSRLSLGDACSLAYCTKNDFPKPVNNDKTNSEKLKISERSGDQKIMEVVEEFTNRANKLDNDFQRLDMTASVVDVRAEFQELERFAVINRFAKFHVRGQMDASGTSSSSAAPKPIPQRHVLAFPMPRNLPEGVQCLSL